ncbi:MAG: redox-sensing transcriptional repressor Rex [Bacteroidota bacterium]
MKNELPRNTVVRLSQYRRLLEKYKYLDEPYIFSHDLARMLDLKPVNIRHDLMLLGISGDRRKGYSVNALLEKIGESISCPGHGIVLVGMGRLGLSLIDYINNSESCVKILAAFDVDPAKVQTPCEAVPAYSIFELRDYITKYNIKTAILTVPSEETNDILPILLDAGIKGILNYTSEQLIVPDDITVRNVDVISFLEEIAYFVKE